MNDGLKFGPHTEVFAVDGSRFVTLVLPNDLCDFFFNSTDRVEIYEMIIEAYQNRFDDNDI